MRAPLLLVVAVWALPLLVGCQRSGPARDAKRALDHGDQRALALIFVGSEGDIGWGTLGLSCEDAQPVPLRKVGRVLKDHERYQAYVTQYNEALSADRRYRYRAHCGARSRFPNGIEHAVR